jgi:hypothetical protein
VAEPINGDHITTRAILIDTLKQALTKIEKENVLHYGF